MEFELGPLLANSRAVAFNAMRATDDCRLLNTKTKFFLNLGALEVNTPSPIPIVVGGIVNAIGSRYVRSQASMVSDSIPPL